MPSVGSIPPTASTGARHAGRPSSRRRATGAARFASATILPSRRTASLRRRAPSSWPSCRCSSGSSRGTVTALASDDDSQDYEVTWSTPTVARGVGLGAAGGVAIGAASLAAFPSLLGALVALAAPLALGGLGLTWSRDRLRRMETAAQAMRVHALERSLAIRETESRSGAGDLEGNVVAGQYRIGAPHGLGRERRHLPGDAPHRRSSRRHQASPRGHRARRPPPPIACVARPRRSVSRGIPTSSR